MRHYGGMLKWAKFQT